MWLNSAHFSRYARGIASDGSIRSNEYSLIGSVFSVVGESLTGEELALISVKLLS